MKHLYTLGIAVVVIFGLVSLSAAYTNFNELSKLEMQYAPTGDQDVLGHRIGPTGELELVRPMHRITK